MVLPSRPAGETSRTSRGQEQVDRIDQDMPDLVARARQRMALPRMEDLLARVWQALSAGAAGDPHLERDLAAALVLHPQGAGLHNALGLAITLTGQGGGTTTAALAGWALGHFQRAQGCPGGSVVAGLNVVEALVGLGRTEAAIVQARRGLRDLDC